MSFIMNKCDRASMSASQSGNWFDPGGDIQKRVESYRFIP